VITLTCDNCDKAFQVEDDAQPGEKVSCPYCGDINRVPTSPKGGAAATPPRGLPVEGRGAAPMRPNEDDPEHPVLTVRQAMFRAHPFLFSFMVLLILAGLAWMVIAASSAAWAPWHVWLGLTVAALGVVWWLLWWAAPHRWVKLIITSKRTVRQEGIIVRKTSEVLHSHIRNVKIEQSVLQRLFGVGSIAIDSAGGSDAQPIEIEMRNVAKPYDVKAVIDQYRGI
jgi:membrane protein YdbS with pleckstrin-like domain